MVRRQRLHYHFAVLDIRQRLATATKTLTTAILLLLITMTLLAMIAEKATPLQWAVIGLAVFFFGSKVCSVSNKGAIRCHC